MADRNRTDVDWEDVRVFVALARYGSLSGAARALSVNHATVSRRIRSLEATLGEKLVERRPHGYVLTPAGTHALASASDMEVAAATLGRRGAENEPMGLARVSAPPSLAQSFLVDHLAKLSVQYTGLDIEVATDLRAVSLDRREADIALRLGRPPDGYVIAKPLVVAGFGFYATAEHCRRIENGEAPLFVGFDELNAHLPEAVWLSRHFPNARISFRTSSQTAQAAAAKSGAGIALLPHFVGRTACSLRPCCLEPVPPPRKIWLITRRQDRKNLLISTVVEFITQLFAQKCELFEDHAATRPTSSTSGGSTNQDGANGSGGAA